MPKPIRIDLPYPSLDCIEPNYKIAKIIAPAYATAHGELNATLQYIYHFFNFERVGDKQTAQTLMGIAIAEMEHLEILGTLLVKLGVDPIYTHLPPYGIDFYCANRVSYSKTPVKMLLDDISAEMLAVKDYKSMVERIDDEQVSAIIARITLDEELHITVLKDILKKYSKSC